jgi:transposase
MMNRSAKGGTGRACTMEAKAFSFTHPHQGVCGRHGTEEQRVTSGELAESSGGTARWLMTHPGVGPLIALAFVLIIGRADRFQCGKQIASYLGLVPLEDSSGNRRRLGHITKQGSSMLRFLMVEASQVTVRSLPEWRGGWPFVCIGCGARDGITSK